MMFSEMYKSQRSPLAKLRQSQSELPPITSNGNAPGTSSSPGWAQSQFAADLLCKDKARQKEAIKKYLSTKVRNDWDFTWPPPTSIPDFEHDSTAAPKKTPNGRSTSPHLGEDSAPPVQDETAEDEGYQVDEEESGDSAGEAEVLEDDDDSRSVYSTVSVDALNYRPRLEWASDLSDEETQIVPHVGGFQFSPPNTAGAAALHAAVLSKRDKRRKQIRDEASWNEGLACFMARRDAWTGAKTVRVRTKAPVSPSSGASPRSPRRFFFRRSISSSPPSPATGTPNGTDAAGHNSDSSSLPKGVDRDLGRQQTKDSTSSASHGPETYPVYTLLPVPPPILPPENGLRASINPNVYINLYEKVIEHNLQPSCPINLADMIRSCVTGWQRDGEWPPRPAVPSVPISSIGLSQTVRRKQSSGSRKKKRDSVASIGNENGGGGNMARRMSFGLLGREKDDDSKTGKGIRRSLQKAFGIGTAIPADGEALEGENQKA